MARKQKTEVVDGEQYREITPTEPPTEEPARKSRKPKTDITLSELADRYLQHMESEGKSSGTCFSYKLELQVALAELGGETKLADLTSERVVLFLGSDRVLKTRTGRPKSPLSTAKTARVLKQALAFAERKGFVEKAPLPEDLATH